jgi:tetratricopeptide (TPR) repeat protein
MTFIVGAGFYDKFGTTFAVDDEDLKESFAYFNGLDPESEAIADQIRDGVQVATGAPLVKVGTYMAEKLQERFGEGRLDELRRNGSTVFFKTYIDLYRGDDSIPDECRFAPDFETMVDAWYASYMRTWDEDTRGYFLIPLVDFGDYIDDIKARFTGEIVYPRLNDQFNLYAYYLKAQKREDEGLAVLLDAVKLYPSDANLFDSIGEFYLAEGDAAKAADYYKRALEVDPNLRSATRALEKMEGYRPLDYLIKHSRVKAGKKLENEK